MAVRSASFCLCYAVCGGCRGYELRLHGVVGLLRVQDLLVGVCAQGRGCQ